MNVWQMTASMSSKKGGPTPECSTIPIPYSLNLDIGMLFNTNKFVLRQSIQAFMLLPAHLDDGE